MTWTLKKIQDLKSAGKIRGFTEPVKSKDPGPAGRIITKHFKRKSKGLDFIGWNIVIWSQENKFKLMGEFMFHPERKWKFDFAIPEKKIAVEYEGGIYDRNGSHTSVKDILRDTEKYNAAASLGWRVLRFNAINYETLISELNKLIS